MQPSSSAVLLRSVGVGLWLLATASPAATLTVTSNADAGAGSLRQAIADALSGDTIVFDAALNGGVITLASELAFDKSLNIVGPGPDLLTIDGNLTSRIFTLNPGAASDNTVRISGLLLTRGSALAGGAIATETAHNTRPITLTVSNCVLRANRATDVGSAYTGGGGLAARRNTFLTMTDCMIAENWSGPSGGGVWLYSASTIARCSFVGNVSTRSGGGMHIRHEGLVSIRHCTFSQNEAASGFQAHQDGGGGGICTEEKPRVSIFNSTFTLNYVNGNNADKHRGGGIFVRGIQDSTQYVVLHSTLIAGNTSNQAYPDVAGELLATNSLIQVTNGVSIVGANNIFGQAAQLEALADNGGLTQTHALKKNSPAIDKGYNPLGLVTDQRGAGFPRQLGTAVDIGAFEYKPQPSGTVVSFR